MLVLAVGAGGGLVAGGQLGNRVRVDPEGRRLLGQHVRVLLQLVLPQHLPRVVARAADGADVVPLPGVDLGGAGEVCTKVATRDINFGILIKNTPESRTRLTIAHWGSPFINSQGMKQGRSC